MKYVIWVIIRSHVYILFIFLGSCIFEILTKRKLKLILDDLTWKKSKEMASGSADVFASLYFVISLLVLLYNVYIKHNAPTDYRFWKWLVIMVPLTVIFRKLYYKLQAKDPKKKGVHYD